MTRDAVHGVAKSRIRLSDFTFTFYFHALEKEMAPGSLSEGSDSCFVSQEKLKPGYLKEIPGRMKLFSVFLGKRCWFAGNKVRGMAFGEGELSFFPRLRVWCTFLLCLPAAHLCGFPGL